MSIRRSSQLVQLFGLVLICVMPGCSHDDTTSVDTIANNYEGKTFDELAVGIGEGVVRVTFADPGSIADLVTSPMQIDVYGNLFFQAKFRGKNTFGGYQWYHLIYVVPNGDDHSVSISEYSPFLSKAMGLKNFDGSIDEFETTK